MKFFWKIFRKGFFIATSIAAVPVLGIVVLWIANPPSNTGDAGMFGAGLLLLMVGFCYGAALILIALFAAFVQLVKKGN